MVYVFLASGFEEVEAIAPIDVLRRGGIKVTTVGVTGKQVTSSHNLEVTADVEINRLVLDDSLEAVILPGGMPGTLNLELNGTVSEAIDYAYKNDKYICAICAAPMIIGKKGLLSGKQAICFPGNEKYLTGATISDKSVVRDGKFITAKGAGVALQFGGAILSALTSPEHAKDILSKMQFSV